MTVNQLARKLARRIAKREGKKHQASFGDIMEILKIIATMEAACVGKGKHNDKTPLNVLCKYALTIYKKNKKKAGKK